MEQKFDNAMRRQVYSIPELITQQYDLMEPRIREALSFQEIFSLQHIIITGCGDSMAAAMAVKQAFEQLTKMPIEVLPAIDVARFYPQSAAVVLPMTLWSSLSATLARSLVLKKPSCG